MIANQQGYPKDRFTELKGDSFDCAVCLLVCRNPKECTKCGTMFCANCIDSWIQTHNECPIGCQNARNSIQPVTGALSKIYKNLDIKCGYPDCDKVVKLCDLEQHEAGCNRPKCLFFEQCGNKVNPESNDKEVCDAACSFMKKIKEANGDWKAVYEEAKNMTKVMSTRNTNSSIVSGGNSNYMINQTSINFSWSTSIIGQGIELSNNNKSVFLKETGYIFRSVVADAPMMSGIHYWEIHADPRTENELKIGITTKKEFNPNMAFCDFAHGFAYYGLGQLRYGSNSNGGAYGKKFKKSGALGICLDMTRGTLSFALDGDYWGEAFNDESLKKGPVYAAVALLHQAGCTLVTGKPVPQYFLRR